MSLDVYLYKEITKRFDVFQDNITHNLAHMAREAMLYYPLWRPDEIGIEVAGDLIPFLKAGLMLLNSNREQLIEECTPDNGWGGYENLLVLTTDYLEACTTFPDALIYVSR